MVAAATHPNPNGKTGILRVSVLAEIKSIFKTPSCLYANKI